MGIAVVVMGEPIAGALVELDVALDERPPAEGEERPANVGTRAARAAAPVDNAQRAAVGRPQLAR
jgi:hypothetical protein